MCDHCESDDTGPQVTEGDMPAMIHECTAVALQASAAFTNGWHSASRGYLHDMARAWGGHSTLRMCYVWGAGRFFLPAPPGRDSIPGQDEIATLLTGRDGTGPTQEKVTALVAIGDQIGAAMQAVSLHASRGDLDALSQTITDWGKGATKSKFDALLLALMADCGVRLRYSRDVDDTRAYDLFMAHINADMPCTHDHEPEGETGDASS